MPTFVEQGYDQVNLVPFIVILGPKGSPANVGQAWEKSLRVIGKDPEFIATCRKAGVHVDVRTGAQILDEVMKEALQKYSRFTPEELGWAKTKK